MPQSTFKKIPDPLASTITTCCYPECEAELSATVSFPLCDPHVIKAYRKVADAMKDAERRDQSIGHLAEGHGTVYIVRLGNRIKIGHTTNLTQRLREVPYEEVLATYVGTVGDEKRLHTKFKDARIVREWFEDCAAIREFVSSTAA